MFNEVGVVKRATRQLPIDVVPCTQNSEITGGIG